MKIFTIRQLKLYIGLTTMTLLLLVTPVFAIPLAQTGTTAQPPVTVKQLLQDGDDAFKNEQYSAALTAYQKALTLAQAAQDQPATANAYYKVGRVYRKQTLYSKSNTTFQQALSLFQQLNDAKRTANVLLDIGANHADLAKNAAALAALDQP